jgi:RimJ/RimL family protein N-acetyltransferase
LIVTRKASWPRPNTSIEIVLATERLYLRRFVPGDAVLLFELDSDPEVMRFITKGKPTPLAQIEKVILPRILDHYQKSPTQGCWAAHLSGSDDFIGWFHLRPDKITPQEMELGYRLKRIAWGRGLATEGTRALLEVGFREWDCTKMSARTLIGNLASQRVIQKAGLQFEGEFVYSVEIIPGWTEQERRAVKYGLSRDQFLAQPETRARA